MNEMLFDACVADACEHIDCAIELLHDACNASEACNYTDDTERIKDVLHKLHLLYESLM